MPSDVVTVAYVHPNEVAHSWQRSLLDLVGWDMAHEGHVIQGGWIAVRYGADGLVAARNKAVEEFLASDATEWMFWVDTDMGFQPDTVDRLLEAAHPTDRPIVGALCFAQKEYVNDGMGGWRAMIQPTIYDWETRDGVSGLITRPTYPINTLLRCGGTGSACVLIHRTVFERIADRYGPTWYDRVPHPEFGGQLIGEDLSFCVRAGSLSIPIYVHTGIRTTHFKEFWLAEADYWNRAVAPPATQETAVIVPVLGRPEHAAPFMASLRASTGLATCYAICQSGDDDAAAAWLDAGAQVLESGEQTTFAAKANLGYSKTAEPWLFLVGSDVHFHPAWLDHAQAVGADRYHVVGTNDLGNPRVTSGEHATHLLIRRSYVDEVGPSWDGPGVVCHEGYRHWFVDDEIVTAAKQRGVWAMSLASKVEHLHPLWGKANMDVIYALGQQHAAVDKEQFLKRLAAHAPKVTFHEG